MICHRNDNYCVAQTASPVFRRRRRRLGRRRRDPWGALASAAVAGCGRREWLQARHFLRAPYN